MTAEQRAQILQALWPEGAQSGLGVWAVLDCARDPQVYLALLESRLEFRCLYSGALPRELEMVAPQLVELSPTSRLMGRWLDAGWGRAWGLFMKIEDPANLRQHLRKLLQVRAQDGRSLLFRFYDPRVLGSYLPTCNAGESRQVFGPIDAFFVEAQGGGELLEFRLAGGALRRAALPIGALAG